MKKFAVYFFDPNFPTIESYIHIFAENESEARETVLTDGVGFNAALGGKIIPTEITKVVEIVLV